jgi:hypothetical protein
LFREAVMVNRFYIDRLQTPIGRALLLTHAEETLRAFDWDYRTAA